MSTHYWRALRGIAWREILRFLQQRERFIAALVRPLLWLLVFAAGFRTALGVSVMSPYGTTVTYETYIIPGLVAMIQLFNGMQSSLSMVYDREMGSMRLLLTAPLPRWFLLFSRLLASVLVSLIQVYVFLIIARVAGVDPPVGGYLAVLPVLMATGLMFGAIGMALSSKVTQLENFAGVMNFVIFPMLFASSALYPLWKMQEASDVLFAICRLNPFTHAVELIRFALYIQIDWSALGIVTATALLFLVVGFRAYRPSRGMLARNHS